MPTPVKKRKKTWGDSLSELTLKAGKWDELAAMEPLWAHNWRVRLGMIHGKWLNFVYLIGSTALIGGFSAQIARTWSMKEADEFTILLPILVAVGHFLHIPRAFTSHFWVWWVSQGILAVLAITLLVLVVMYS